MKLKTFTFEDKENEISHIVWAEDEIKAQRIIDVANTLSPFHFVLIKGYIRFMDTPFNSYKRAEEEQLKTEYQYLENRKSKLN